MEGILVDIAVKGTAVLVVAGALVLGCRNASAATRHLIWSMGLACAAILPVLATLVPRWTVGLLPATPAVPAVESMGGVGTSPAGVPWGAIVVGVWLAGATVVFVSIAVGRWHVRRLARAATTIEGGDWSELVNELSGTLGLDRRIEIRRSDRPMVPMTWGIVRPVVLVPEEAEFWSADLRRSVLLHELVHVRRHDYLTQLVARLAVALHWFNPLVWIASRRLRIERERACDDQVLDSGASACDYADHLLRVARELCPSRRPVLAVGMTDPKQFRDRVVALLDAGRSRAVMTRRRALSAGTVAACIVLPLAAVDPEPASAPEAPVGPVAAAVAPAARVEPPPPPPSPAVNAGTAIPGVEAPKDASLPDRREAGSDEAREGEAPRAPARPAPKASPSDAPPSSDHDREATRSAPEAGIVDDVSAIRGVDWMARAKDRVRLDRARYEIVRETPGSEGVSTRCEEAGDALPTVPITPVKHAAIDPAPGTS